MGAKEVFQVVFGEKMLDKTADCIIYVTEKWPKFVDPPV